MKTARKPKMSKPIHPAKRGAKSRVKEPKVTNQPVPVKKIEFRAAEARVEAKPVIAPKIRDEDGRVIPGLTVARMTGAICSPGSSVPAGGADWHKQDRSVEFLPAGAIVPPATT